MNRKLITLGLCAALSGLVGCAHDNRTRERTTVSAVTNEEMTGDREEPGKTRMSYTQVGDKQSLNHDQRHEHDGHHEQGRAERGRREGERGRGEEPSVANVDAMDPKCGEAIYFEQGSAALGNIAEQRLAVVAECMKRREIDHATIVGHTDSTGTEEQNRKLGLERAKAVAAYLQSLGVPEKEIRVRSQGELASAESEELWPQERRANVEGR